MPYLYGDPLKCTGCRICELYCSLRHERVLNPKKARLRVIRKEPAIDKPIACLQCADPPCAKVCPTNAITRDAKADMVVVEESKCIGCGACVEACPFGAIWLHPERKVAIKCDLCEACVPRCPVNALSVMTPGRFADQKRIKLVSRWKPILIGRIPIPRG
jgi:Fe-S-cluster-containing hydrogenase component 2